MYVVHWINWFFSLLQIKHLLLTGKKRGLCFHRCPPDRRPTYQMLTRFELIWQTLRADASSSCFLQLMDLRRPSTTKKSKFSVFDTDVESIDTPKPLPDQAAELGAILSEISASDAAAIEKATRGQSDCIQWRNQRKGRITATRMKPVYTMVTSLDSDKKDVDPSNLIKQIVGYTVAPTTRAMKHGKAQEPHAKLCYEKLQRKKHKSFTVQESGLLVMQEFQFIGASPDLVVECQCHGKGLCEIKCPFKTRDRKPTSEYLPYLVSGAGEQDSLKRNHEYFFQVQGQMGVSGLMYCDLFIYTSHGFHLERIMFDTDFWIELLRRLRNFWQQHVRPELLEPELGGGHETKSPTASTSQDHTYCSPTAPLPQDKLKAATSPKN